jgi:hypothetical protein
MTGGAAPIQPLAPAPLMTEAERAEFDQWRADVQVWQTLVEDWKSQPVGKRGSPPEKPVRILAAAEVLRAETLQFLGAEDQVRYLQWETTHKEWIAAHPQTNDDTTDLPSAFDAPFSALCLSGGGIRSAAFCLGVIQAFAARGLLKQFHYLSTVSGGGYIGGWLTRCIKAWKGDIDKVQAQLNVYRAGAETAALARRDRLEPPELRRLRRYTNFLTPSPGFASTDSWAIIMLWLRNTLINWAVFTPLFLAAAGIPVLYYALTCLFGGTDPGHPWYWCIFCGFGFIGLFSIGIANYRICLNLPTHKQADYDRDPYRERGFGMSGPQIMRMIGIYSLAWTFLAPLAVAPLEAPPQAQSGVHAAYFGDEQPAPVCNKRPGKTLPKRPELPSQASCQPPRQTALLPAVLERPFKYLPAWQHAALYLLPALLWCTYLVAFFLARYNIFLQYDEARTAAPGRAKAARAAAKAQPGNAFLAAEAKARMQEVRIAKKLLQENLRAFDSNLAPWIISGLVGALALFGGLQLDFGQNALWLALAGPLWITGAESLRSAAYVGVRKDGLFSDLDREWLARLSGDKLRISIFFGAIGTAAVFLPWLVLDNFQATDASIGALLGSGTLTAFIGQRASSVFLHGLKVEDDKSFWTLNRLIPVLAVIFAASLFMLAGRLDIIVACTLANILHGIETFIAGKVTLCPGLDEFGRVCWALGISIAGFGGLAILIDHGVNLNRFSLHAVYRNRIIRAFLGTARAWFLRDLTPHEVAHGGLEGHESERIENRYTGFSPGDNMRMSEAMAHRTEQRLFPVIHATLNRTTGKDTARAARKGVPFTVTPLHCGSPSLKKWQGAYVETAYYAGGEKETGVNDRQDGISLGTAMAISGAAVSPNMGYNSSPFTAFLMTLFNVRLGAWLPNPAVRNLKPQASAAFFAKAGPIQAIPTMLEELTGQSDDNGKYVYLSDGGHFDNLGLYEMLRRRCKYIFVVDAGADKDYSYFDLGHTLEMAAIDLGVQIVFAPSISCGEPKTQPPIYADITYPPDHRAKLAGSKGQLIYLKPWLPPDIAIELGSYKKIKTAFPQEPTSDQFFTESDFESYRRLGDILTSDMLKTLPDGADIAKFFERVRSAQRTPPLKPAGTAPLHARPPLFRKPRRPGP